MLYVNGSLKTNCTLIKKIASSKKKEKEAETSSFCTVPNAAASWF